MKRTISKKAIILISIQTILTLGINWIYFLVYYHLEKDALNTVTNVKSRKILDRISLITCLIFLSVGTLFYYLGKYNSVYFLLDKTSSIGKALVIPILISLLGVAFTWWIYKQVRTKLQEQSEESSTSETYFPIIVPVYIIAICFFLYIYWLNHTKEPFRRFSYDPPGREISIFSIEFPVILFLVIIPTIYLVLNHLYKVFISSVYIHRLNRIDQVEIDGDVETRRLYNMILLTVISLGLYFILYLIVSAIYELYLYILTNRNYKLSKRGIGALLLLVVIQFMSIYYGIKVGSSNFMMYSLIIAALTPILSYGFFELRMILIIPEQIKAIKVSKTSDETKFGILGFVILVLVMVLLVTGFNTPEYSVDEFKMVNYNEEFECNIVGTNTICVNELNEESAEYQDLTVEKEYYNGDQIKSEPIHFLRNDKKEIVYSSEPKLIKQMTDIPTKGTEDDHPLKWQYVTRYTIITSYYKKVEENKYIPLFNINKQLMVDAGYDEGYALHPYFEISDNTVFLYNFANGSYTEYRDEFVDIDTTRLMVELNDIQLSSSKKMVGYSLSSNRGEMQLLPYQLSDIRNSMLALFDPFMISQSYLFKNDMLHDEEEDIIPVNTNENRVYVFRPGIEDAITTRLELGHGDLNKINYLNDRYYLVMKYYNYRDYDHRYSSFDGKTRTEMVYSEYDHYHFKELDTIHLENGYKVCELDYGTNNYEQRISNCESHHDSSRVATNTLDLLAVVPNQTNRLLFGKTLDLDGYYIKESRQYHIYYDERNLVDSDLITRFDFEIKSIKQLLEGDAALLNETLIVDNSYEDR